MVFLDKRVSVICKELEKLKVKQQEGVTGWQYKEGCFYRPDEALKDSTPFEIFDCEHMHWYGKDRHYWFRTTLTVPQSFDKKPLWLKVKSQIEEWDDAKNPQFLLFINGEVVQGMDMNHREVLLTESAHAGDTYEIDLQAYSGILHEEFNLIVQIMEIDAEIEELYYDLWVPLAAFSRMEQDDRNRKQIEEILNTTVNYLDLRTPYSKAFYDSLHEAKKYIDRALYQDHAGYADVIASCIGHTHIDVAWWWTVAQTREKVARSFATVLKLMEEYPNYRFMSSQPQLYVFLKERYPEVYEKLKTRVREKRWEPEGGMWVEADCNLTSGESLARQFMYGKRFFREEFGVENRILWLPDVFGYSGALPQIMKKCGIDYFMTTKLAWNQFNKIPYDTMRWRGIDGTEILTHLITTLGVDQPVKDYFTTYNGMLHPDAIMGGWLRYQNKDINNDILVSYGYGDGGGGPTREMLETSKRMEKGIRGIPKVRQVFARTYFDELNERVADHKRLPVWEGELYFEYHRGTYTSMARNKRANRKMELTLMDLELLSVLAEAEAAYPRDELENMWKTVLINQFHDILPGSSIHEVYEVTKKEYATLFEQAARLTKERLRMLAAGDGAYTVFNTTGFARDDIAFIEGVDETVLTDDTGRALPLQKVEGGILVDVKKVPAKGYTVLRPAGQAVSDVTPSDADKSKRQSGNAQGEHSETVPFVLRNDRCLETPYYVVEFNTDGTFRRIYDKECDREVLQENAAGNLFRMYEDKPIYYDNWDIDIFYTEKSWDITQLTSFAWVEKGPVRMALEMTRQEGETRIRQLIYFYASHRKIEFKTYVDWKEHQTLLKVHFPVNVHTDEATFEIQFGNLTRKTHTNTSWDVARFESCGQKWMDLSEGHYGVSLLNDCKYGHSVKDSNIALTLIKSGIEPNPVTDVEEHFFTYALYPHAEGWQEAGTVREAYFLNQPLITSAGRAERDSYSFAGVDKNNVVIETIKRAEDDSGIVIRLYESENALTKTKLTVQGGYQKAFLCNLLEEEEKEAEICNDEINLIIKPYEIVTVKLCDS